MKYLSGTPYSLLGSWLIVMLFTSCNYVKNVKLLTGGSLERSEFVETIPFEYKKDLIVVEAQINGQNEKRKFILDTGAFDSKIEIGLAEELRLPTKATKSNSTAQGIIQTIEVTQLGHVQLGGTQFHNISAGKLEYDDESASQCIAPHGIIGANLMKLAHWKINYQNQTIQFSDQAFTFQENDYHSLKFDKPLLSGTPEIELQVEGKTVSGVMFDVGYNGGLVLPASLSGSFPSNDEKKYYDRSTSGIFGTNTDTLISKMLSVTIGGYDMNIPVEFSSIGKALLGNDILEHFEVIIDYDNREIKLNPKSEIDVSPPFAFIPGVLNDSLWVVNRSTPDLPFALGDTLQSINGQRPSDLFVSFCDYVMNINEVLESDLLTIAKKELTQAQDLNSQIKKAEFLIQHHQQQTKTPGIQVAVLKHGELVWSMAFGVADIEGSVELETITPMRVASVSKSMTSIALGELVEKGVIDLDADVRTYVPEFLDKGVTITARHLAASTSGIRHYTADDPEYNNVHYPSVIEALAPFKSDQLLFEPGTDYHYSSYGWVLLSAAMERASGTSFQKLMQETWADLEMNHTYFDHPNYHPETICSQYIVKQPGLLKRLFLPNKVERIRAPKEDRSYMYAGGGYLSTAEDLVKMGWELISNNYLEASTVETLFEDYELENGTNTYYGLGWEVGQSRTGTPVAFHSGSMSSARSHLVIYPEENLVFAILMNTGDQLFFNDREAQTIAELFLLESEKPQEFQSIAGQWDIHTTSLRNKKSKGKMDLSIDNIGTVSGTITFTRSQKKKTFPVVLAGVENNEYHFVGVSPMFMDIYITLDENSFSGTWLHDFNVIGIPEADPYWKPREIQGVKSNHDP